MKEPKKKEESPLRTPQPKKKLGLVVKLNMPHDDLIQPEQDMGLRPLEVNNSDEISPRAAQNAESLQQLSGEAGIVGRSVGGLVGQPVTQTVGGTDSQSVGESSAVRPRFVRLEHTHTQAEQLIYNAMYGETISKGVREGRFSTARLRALTPIKSKVTIGKALQGLLAKRSIELVEQAEGMTGAKYRIFKPNEIFTRRHVAGVIVDIETRKIIKGDTQRQQIKQPLGGGIVGESVGESVGQPPGVPSYITEGGIESDHMLNPNNRVVGDTPTTHGAARSVILESNAELFEELRNRGFTVRDIANLLDDAADQEMVRLDGSE